MSELTPCNYHTLLGMKAKYGDENVHLSNEQGWIAVRIGEDKEPRTWFLELTDDCVC